MPNFILIVPLVPHFSPVICHEPSTTASLVPPGRTIVPVICYSSVMASRGNTRESLLHLLRQEFEQLGYDGATLSQLAAATGLSKASLYHHFPAGKAEMAAVLLRESVAELEKLAFSRLSGPQSANRRLVEFLTGFSDYARAGEGSCLVTVFSNGTAAATHGDTVAQQYRDWIRRLAVVFEELGMKPKRAERQATELLSGLYGHLSTARITREPERFRRYVKRMKKQFAD
jgi:AcrR family transcriptional regulator